MTFSIEFELEDTAWLCLSLPVPYALVLLLAVERGFLGTLEEIEILFVSLDLSNFFWVAIEMIHIIKINVPHFGMAELMKQDDNQSPFLLKSPMIILLVKRITIKNYITLDGNCIYPLKSSGANSLLLKEIIKNLFEMS